MKRRRLHQVVFAGAAIYNVGWGLLTALRPQWLFDAVGIEQTRYPEIFACLGMVIGLYGLLYLQVARDPERGWWIAAVGFAGKLLGPVGMGFAVATGAWPWQAFLYLNLSNDFVWLPFFALYLWDARGAVRRS